MYYDNKIWVANDENGDHISLEPKLANRHGLIAGATGTGKTVTLKVLAESFSDMGVPVFLADVKGDLAGIADAGSDSDDMKERIARFGLSDKGFSYHGYPVTMWDIYGKNGIQLRTTVSEMGPLLLARLLDINQLQSDILSVVFKIADDEGMLLLDTKDLKSMLNYVSENHAAYESEYGKMSPQSIAAIMRAVVALESAGGDIFFGEPALSVTDWFATGENGRGMIHVLDSSSLINNGKLYATFLLWLLAELFENLPEVGDLDKPKMVYFFDEAHLLFNDAPKALIDKVEQVVKLIRSKGVGVYFVTQNPSDIPDAVLAQLGNKIEHALHAYTPAEQKKVKAAADSFRTNPELNTYDAIQSLGTGEAVISFLTLSGEPDMVKKACILPPQSKFGSIDDARRSSLTQGSVLYTRYANSVDRESAYEILAKKGQEAAEAKAAADQAKLDEKAAIKAEKDAAKAAEKAAAKEAAKKQRAVKSVATTVSGTVGREVGKQVGKNFGKFGTTLGGNVGASIGRGILSTLFKG